MAIGSLGLPLDPVVSFGQDGVHEFFVFAGAVCAKTGSDIFVVSRSFFFYDEVSCVHKPSIELGDIVPKFL